MKINKSYNVQVWVGLKECYNDEKTHKVDDVYKICGKFVDDRDWEKSR